mgnify:CR=1 FL=1
MSHHHDPHDPHDHPHSHDHGHSHGEAGEMPFNEKIARLLDHWVQHNDDHVRSYRQWAEKARSHGLAETAAALDKAAETTAAVTEAFHEARASVPDA